MKRIIWHWTAGVGIPNAVDLRHYHYLFDVSGAEHKGKWPVSANRRIVGTRFAAHTRGLNPGSIGLAICGMAGARQGREARTARVLPTRKQIDKMCRQTALLAIEHGIKITPKTVLCHSEVERNLGIKQNGKWDIEWLPWSWAPCKNVGDWLRIRTIFFQGKILKKSPRSGKGKEDRPLK